MANERGGMLIGADISVRRACDGSRQRLHAGTDVAGSLSRCCTSNHVDDDS